MLVVRAGQLGLLSREGLGYDNRTFNPQPLALVSFGPIKIHTELALGREPPSSQSYN